MFKVGLIEGLLSQNWALEAQPNLFPSLGEVKMASRLSSFNILILVFLLSQLCLSDVNGLRCYKCLAMDCSDMDTECNEIRSYIQSELKLFYYFETDLKLCPPPDRRNEGKWLAMKESVGDSCPEPENATCTVGRMGIETKEYNSFGDVNKIKLNHATILGCAKPSLISRVSKSFKNNKCDYVKFSRSSPIAFQQIEAEHCLNTETYCSNEDYCIRRWESRIRSGHNIPSTNYFTLVMGGWVIFGVVFLGLAYMIIFHCSHWIARCWTFQRLETGKLMTIDDELKFINGKLPS